jgi:DNA polymerase I-like protein with 3'-5' exonuclease and polymerase domains
MIEDGELGEPKKAIFYHDEVDYPDSPNELILDLTKASKVIAHNAKFDLLYLQEANFPIPKKVHCTMVGEYLLARGQHIEKSLKATAL